MRQKTEKDKINLENQIFHLLLNYYPISKIDEQIIGCNYLFCIAKVKKQKCFYDLAIDLLHEILKSVYSEVVIKKEKNFDCLIWTTVYLNLISKVENFDMDISEVLKTINEEIFKRAENDLNIVNLLYVILNFNNPQIAILERKKIKSLFDKIGNLLTIQKLSNIDIFILSTTIYISEMSQRSQNIPFLANLLVILKGRVKVHNIDEKILLIFSLWILNPLVDILKIINRIKKFKYLESKLFFLIQYIYIRLNIVKPAKVEYKEDLLDNFDRPIINFLNDNSNTFNIDFLITTTIGMLIRSEKLIL